MSDQVNTKLRAQRRIRRVRTKIVGSASRPRLSVTLSNRHVRAQLVDDETAKTLVYVSTANHKQSKSLSAKSEWVGTEIGKQAKAAKITKVVLDRRSHLYHGRLKALAQAVREQGIEF